MVIFTDNETGQRFRFKDGTSAAEAQAKIQNYFAREEKRQQQEDEEYKAFVRENTGLGEAAWQSTKRGFSQLPILTKQALGAGIGAFGGTETSRKIMESAAADQQRLAEENPRIFDSFTANPLGYTTEALFENLPNIAGVIGTGGLGVGVRAGIGALGKAGARELGEEALKAGVKSGARKAFERGAAAGSYGMAVGETFGEHVDKYGYDQASPWTALGAGVPIAAADIVGLGRLEKLFQPKALSGMTDDALRGLMGREVSTQTAKEMLQKAGKEVTEDTVNEAAERLTRAAQREAVRRNTLGEITRRGIAGMATEGTTEALQEATKIGAGSLSQGQGLSELGTPEALGQIGEAGLGGALVGGTFGGIGGTYRGLKRRGEAERELGERAQTKEDIQARGKLLMETTQKQMADEAAAAERERRWQEQQALRGGEAESMYERLQAAQQAKLDAIRGPASFYDPNANVQLAGRLGYDPRLDRGPTLALPYTPNLGQAHPPGQQRGVEVSRPFSPYAANAAWAGAQPELLGGEYGNVGFAMPYGTPTGNLPTGMPTGLSEHERRLGQERLAQQPDLFGPAVYGPVPRVQGSSPAQMMQFGTPAPLAGYTGVVPQGIMTGDILRQTPSQGQQPLVPMKAGKKGQLTRAWRAGPQEGEYVPMEERARQGAANLPGRIVAEHYGVEGAPSQWMLPETMPSTAEEGQATLAGFDTGPRPATEADQAEMEWMQQAGIARIDPAERATTPYAARAARTHRALEKLHDPGLGMEPDQLNIEKLKLLAPLVKDAARLDASPQQQAGLHGLIDAIRGSTSKEALDDFIRTREVERMQVGAERKPRVGAQELQAARLTWDEFAEDIPGFPTWVQMEDPMFHTVMAPNGEVVLMSKLRADQLAGGQLHEDARSLTNDLREEFALWLRSHPQANNMQIEAEMNVIMEDLKEPLDMTMTPVEKWEKQATDQAAIKDLLRTQREAADLAWEQEMATKSGKARVTKPKTEAGEEVATTMPQPPKVAGHPIVRRVEGKVERTEPPVEVPKLGWGGKGKAEVGGKATAGQRAWNQRQQEADKQEAAAKAKEEKAKTLAEFKQQAKEKRERERLIKRTEREVKQGDTQTARLRRQYDKLLKEQEAKPTKLRERALEKLRTALNKHIQDVHDKRQQIEQLRKEGRAAPQGEAPTASKAAEWRAPEPAPFSATAVTPEQRIKSAAERAKANQARLEQLEKEKKEKAAAAAAPPAAPAKKVRLTAKRKAEIDEQFEELRQAQNAATQANRDYQQAMQAMRTGAAGAAERDALWAAEKAVEQTQEAVAKAQRTLSQLTGKTVTQYPSIKSATPTEIAKQQEVLRNATNAAIRAQADYQQAQEASHAKTVRGAEQKVERTKETLAKAQSSEDTRQAKNAVLRAEHDLQQVQEVERAKQEAKAAEQAATEAAKELRELTHGPTKFYSMDNRGAEMGTEEPNDRLVRFIAENSKGKRTAREVLNKLMMTSKDVRHRRLAQRILALLGNLADSVTFGTGYYSGEGISPLGEYEGTTEGGPGGRGHARIYDTAYKLKRYEETVLHEALHAASIHAYKHNAAFRAEIDALLKEAKEALPNWKGNNALANGEEFIAAIFTNPKLRADLAKAEITARPELAARFAAEREEARPKNLWERVKAAFKKWMNRNMPLPKTIQERMDEILERGWQVESVGQAATPTTFFSSQMRTTPGKLVSVSGETFRSHDQQREYYKRQYEKNRVAQVRAFAEKTLGWTAKKMMLGSMDARTLADRYKEVARKAEGKGIDADAAHKLNRNLHLQEATRQSVMSSFQEDAIKPLVDLERRSPALAEKVEKLLFEASYVQYDPSYVPPPETEGAVKAKPKVKELTDEQRAKEEEHKRSKDRLKQEYEALPKSAQDAFKAVTRTTREHHKEMVEGLRAYHQRLLDDARINAEEVNTPRAHAQYTAMKKHYSKLDDALRELGKVTPYVPFMRHGDFMINYIGKDGIRGSWAFETATQRDTILAQMHKDKVQAEGYNRLEDPDKLLDTMDVAGKEVAEQMKNVRKELAEEVKSGDIDVSKFVDGVEKDLLSMLTSLTPSGRLLDDIRNRRNIPGMQTDLKRGLAAYADSAAKALSSMKHGIDIGRNYAAINRTAKASTAPEEHRILADFEKRTFFDADDLNMLRLLSGEFDKRREFLRQPINAPWANNLGKLGYIYYMGANPSSAVMNLFQTVMVQFPVLASKHGTGKAFTALYDSVSRLLSGAAPLRQFMEEEAYPLVRYEADMINADGSAKEGANDITKAYAKLRTSKNSADQYRAMVVDMLRNGVINDSAVQDLLSFRSGGDPRSKMAKAERAASFMMRRAEQYNRISSAMAAFDLARQDKKKSWNEALDEASNAVYEGHGDYSAINSARWFQGNAGKTLLLFKKFSFHMAGQMYRQIRTILKSKDFTKEERVEAAKKFGLMYLVTAGMTGLGGAPFAGALSTLYYLYKSLFGDDDETRDMVVAMRRGLDSMGFSPGLREFSLKGVGSLVGAEMTSRLGYSDMFFRNPDENRDESTLAQWAGQTIGGPLWSLGAGFAKGIKDVANGDWEHGFPQLAPSFLRNPIRAWIMGSEGAYTTRRGDVILEVGPKDVAFQALGFQPAELSRQREINTAAKAAVRRVEGRKADLMERWRAAWHNGDTEEMMDLRGDIVKHNADMVRMGVPGMQITQQTLERSAKSMDANTALMRHGTLYKKQVQSIADAYLKLGVEEED